MPLEVVVLMLVDLVDLVVEQDREVLILAEGVMYLEQHLRLVEQLTPHILVPMVDSVLDRR